MLSEGCRQITGYFCADIPTSFNQYFHLMFSAPYCSQLTVFSCNLQTSKNFCLLFGKVVSTLSSIPKNCTVGGNKSHFLHAWSTLIDHGGKQRGWSVQGGMNLSICCSMAIFDVMMGNDFVGRGLIESVIPQAFWLISQGQKWSGRYWILFRAC